jgi:hypothetical protein
VLEFTSMVFETPNLVTTKVLLARLILDTLPAIFLTTTGVAVGATVGGLPGVVAVAAGPVVPDGC